MKYRYFRITNFKGIKSLRIDLDRAPKSDVHALVGLNESGKTTILEAINYFQNDPENLSALGIHGHGIDDPHDLIPIDQLANFTGTVSIEAAVDLDEDDEKKFKLGLLAKTGFILAEPLGSVTIEKQIRFENSKYNSEKSKTFWRYQAKGAKTKKARPRLINSQEVFQALYSTLAPPLTLDSIFPQLLV